MRDLAKFLAGFMVADFLTLIWFYAKGLLPISTLGITFTERGVVFGMIFDIIIIMFLVYHGWHLEKSKRSSKEMSFHVIAGIIFTLVAIFHLSRLIFGWQMVLGDWNAPYWLSALGAVVTGFLAYFSFRLHNK
ncbi:MAG: hypothetical protein COU22_01660 [Candidatus Komeilibacteria bacterium CG10_big_fil_rev_8_21_14_0_10_41_13]|uniref:Uncharacterized protein n=1 Tax=Candidatus Komeilibacteria bacterium CG10_big_fil_rev_8_21_14_0_10_41_13 TaxID=1974476 RepID=A0A2M6WCK3_9BACT|nr:MAG: hypothetical protein COU22_01660 [Candidatus Komeilibacteria bacterium CG10_big_fil_rev_8_21_14_0_10_41_13]